MDTLKKTKQVLAFLLVLLVAAYAGSTASALQHNRVNQKTATCSNPAIHTSLQGFTK